jgi:hypothetical protein
VSGKRLRESSRLSSLEDSRSLVPAESASGPSEVNVALVPCAGFPYYPSAEIPSFCVLTQTSPAIASITIIAMIPNNPSATHHQARPVKGWVEKVT